MGLTHFPHGVSSFGIPVLSDYGFGAQGNVFFVDPVTGSDGNPGTSPDVAVKTLPQALSLATANQNDLIIYLSRVSAGLNLAATLDWNKNSVHLIGVCAPTLMNQRARIFHNANFSPMIKVSADGCLFENLYTSYGRGNAANLISLQVTGNRNVFRRCNIFGPGNATEAGTADFNLVDLQGDSAGGKCTETLFEDCVIGGSSLGISAAQFLLLLENFAARPIFRRCVFLCQVSAAGGAGTVFVKVGSTTGVGEFVEFDQCSFINTGSTAMTLAMTYDSTTVGKAILKSPVFVGATGVANSSTAVWISQDTVTAATLGLGQNPGS
jgi:hypothetical protein